MARVVISTIGTGGDVFPFITMGRALAADGHQVTLVTHACYAADAETAGLAFTAVDTLDECDRMIRDGPLLAGGSGLLLFADRHILPRLRAECEMLRAHVVPGETVLIARAIPGFAPRIVAEQTGVPLIGVMMAPANVLGLPLYAQLVEARLGAAVNECRRDLGLPAVDRWKPWLAYRASLGLWPDWFCAPDAAPPSGLRSSGPQLSGLRLVGLLLSEEPGAGTIDEALRRELATGPPAILLTAGTGFFGGHDFFALAVDACRIAGCRPVIVCGQDDLLPAHVRRDALVLPKVRSLAALMRHVAIVCHHGGMGTLGQALAAGVPQLTIAQGGDREDNARRLQQLGVAVSITPRERTATAIGAALRLVTASGAIARRCAELARRVRDTPTLELVCEAVHFAIRDARSDHHAH
jgi:rhamnosyltransferase subunit B